jgi:HK97 family phage prohead protease
VPTRSDPPVDFAREVAAKGLETRVVPGAERVETRADDGDSQRRIVGYGSVSEQTSTIEGLFSDWDEEVAAGAWKKTITESKRILSTFNHDVDRLLGSTSANTLRLSEDDSGLLYDVDINADDPNAMSVYAQVQRGDVAGSSVWFRVLRQEWTYPDESNGLERPKRRVLEARLFETGPVVMPAFPQTTASARAVDAMLRAAGVGDDRRASLTSELLAADADTIEAELRGILTARPELREAVCSCSTEVSSRAAQAPGTDGEPGSSRNRNRLVAAGHLVTMRRA